MRNDFKHRLRTKAWLARGLANALADDLDYLRNDADNFDLYSIDESIMEAKITIRKIFDKLDEIECVVHKAKRR